MFSETAIYERTVKGHQEVQDKTHELTQGERLILILVDGITPYRGLGKKLEGLAEGRLNRSLRSLLGRGLIIEAAASLANPRAEKLTPLVVDRYLQQDPLDPITITAVEHADGKIVADGVGVARGSEDVCSLSVINVPERRRMTSVDFYLPLETMARDAPTGLKPKPAGDGRLHMASSKDEGRRRGDSTGRRRREAQSRRVQMRYWLLFFGLIAAILFVIVQTG